MTDVAFRWPGPEGFSLEVAQFELAAGSKTLLLGPSGSGKSTLLSLLCGNLAPRQGQIVIAGTDIATLSQAARDRFRAEHIGVIFQMFNLLPYGSVIDNVTLPLHFANARRDRTIAAGGSEPEARRLLDALGLDAPLLAKSTTELSVGQQQRVAAARALIGSPDLIVADEPTSALDTDRQHLFLDLLFSQLDHTGSGLIMVSHDRSLAPRFDQVIALADLLASHKSGAAAS
ncbi:MAG: ATP-binding cassette domain-containing protein [Pseudomonadota bacterium]